MLSPKSESGGMDSYVLNCTVLSAATSQPSVCMTSAAIVFPTYLRFRQVLLLVAIGFLLRYIELIDSPINDL